VSVLICPCVLFIPVRAVSRVLVKVLFLVEGKRKDDDDDGEVGDDEKDKRQKRRKKEERNFQ
jgi:hypothetical protein